MLANFIQSIHESKYSEAGRILCGSPELLIFSSTQPDRRRIEDLLLQLSDLEFMILIRAVPRSLHAFYASLSKPTASIQPSANRLFSRCASVAVSTQSSETQFSAAQLAQCAYLITELSTLIELQRYLIFLGQAPVLWLPHTIDELRELNGVSPSVFESLAVDVTSKASGDLQEQFRKRCEELLGRPLMTFPKFAELSVAERRAVATFQKEHPAIFRRYALASRYHSVTLHDLHLGFFISFMELLSERSFTTLDAYLQQLEGSHAWIYKSRELFISTRASRKIEELSVRLYEAYLGRLLRQKHSEEPEATSESRTEKLNLLRAFQQYASDARKLDPKDFEIYFRQHIRDYRQLQPSLDEQVIDLSGLEEYLSEKLLRDRSL